MQNIRSYLCGHLHTHILQLSVDKCVSRKKLHIQTLLRQWGTWDIMQTSLTPVSFLPRCDVSLLTLALLNKTCIGQHQPLVKLARSPWLVWALTMLSSFVFQSFQGPEASQEFRLHQTKLSTCFLRQSGLTPLLWPHFQFLIKYLLAQSLISVRSDLISLQLRLICMAVNTGLTKLTNCDKSKGNRRPLETPKPAFSVWAWLWVTPQPGRLPACSR